MLDKARRNFIRTLSILGVAGFTGISLQAKALAPIQSIGYTRVDAEFDPDGWL